MLSTGRKHLKSATDGLNTNKRAVLKQSQYLGDIPSDTPTANELLSEPDESEIIKTLNEMISDVATDSIETCSSSINTDTDNNKKSKTNIHYCVLYGRINEDTGHDGGNTFVKKVLNTHKDAVQYITDFVKDYIVRRCGIQFYDKSAFSCNIIKDFNGPHIVDGVYVVKNNNSWSIYRISTKLIKGYLGNYADKTVTHLFNLYIAKEMYGHQIMDAEKPNYGDILQELKIKIAE